MSPVSVRVSSDGKIYVSDEDRSDVQIFVQTPSPVNSTKSRGLAGERFSITEEEYIEYE